MNRYIKKINFITCFAPFSYFLSYFILLIWCNSTDSSGHSYIRGVYVFGLITGFFWYVALFSILITIVLFSFRLFLIKEKISYLYIILLIIEILLFIITTPSFIYILD